MIDHLNHKQKRNYTKDSAKLSKTIVSVSHPFIRRRKKEKKKSSSKPAAEGEEQEDVEICLGSGKDDFLYPRHSDSVCIVKNWGLSPSWKKIYLEVKKPSAETPHHFRSYFPLSVFVVLETAKLSRFEFPSFYEYRFLKHGTNSSFAC